MEEQKKRRVTAVIHNAGGHEREGDATQAGSKRTGRALLLTPPKAKPWWGQGKRVPSWSPCHTFEKYSETLSGKDKVDSYERT